MLLVSLYLGSLSTRVRAIFLYFFPAAFALLLLFAIFYSFFPYLLLNTQPKGSYS